MNYSKYGNRKIKTEDGTFDSQHEHKRWIELKLLQRAGEIKELERQVKFELVPKQDGERAIHYVADFVYIDNRTGEKIVEDAKGAKTDVYIIKRKLMLYKHNIRVKEV